LPLDSNEFLYKSLRDYIAETFLALHDIQRLAKNPFLEQYHFTARRARFNFHSNLIMFKAEGRVIESQQEKEMRSITEDSWLVIPQFGSP
jgi:hypothetical protein